MIRGLAAAAALLLAASSPAAAQSPRMASLAVGTAQGMITASAELSFWLTSEVKETIDASLPVVVRYRAEVVTPGRFRDRVVAGATLSRTMRYDRVKESFLLSETGPGGESHGFETVNAAEAERWLATVAALPVAPAASLAPGKRHLLRLRADIEISRRSFPLNILLFFVPDRNQRTAWTVSPPIAAGGSDGP